MKKSASKKAIEKKSPKVEKEKKETKKEEPTIVIEEKVEDVKEDTKEEIKEKVKRVVVVEEPAKEVVEISKKDEIVEESADKEDKIETEVGKEDKKMETEKQKTEGKKITEYGPGEEAEAIFGEEPEKNKKQKKGIVFLVLISVTIAAIIFAIAWFFIFRTSGEDMPEKTVEQAVEEPAPTEQPTPTPVPELDRGELSVKVLNGTGISGVAGKAKTFLENLGYSEIKTGNADSYEYQKTEVSIKEEASEYLDLIIEDLGEDYPTSSDSSTLEEDSLFDIVITVGKES